ncbi:helix-turn-helix domain-containing protein [Candidatus Woesearchaeota archaeon]|nr:helix-turn-helix domain-containing protein [Candidatus Woesearchaeota archaeon]
MWSIKLKLRHDCLFGENCKKCNVECINASSGAFRKGQHYFVYHFGTVFGRNSGIFLKLLKRDKRTHYLETDGNTFLLVEKRKSKEIPGMYVTHDMIYIEPVHVFPDGHEEWHLAAIKRETLTGFAAKFKEAKILNITRTKLKDIYFPRLSPNLSARQRDALGLAQKAGYYQFPKKTSLVKLAATSKLSKSTYREHLKRAEMKILGTAYER